MRKTQKRKKGAQRSDFTGSQAVLGVCVCGTHRADLGGHKVAESVEPADVGLQVAGLPLAEETLVDEEAQ